MYVIHVFILLRRMGQTKYEGQIILHPIPLYLNFFVPPNISTPPPHWIIIDHSLTFHTCPVGHIQTNEAHFLFIIVGMETLPWIRHTGQWGNIMG